MHMERTWIQDLRTRLDEVVCVRGWISVRRDQGKMVFFDVRDMTGDEIGRASCRERVYVLV